MGWASGLFAIAATVLAVSGAFKLGDSAVTRRTLAGLGVPGAGPLALLAGPVELLLGAGAAAAGSRPAAAAVAAAFALFAAVTGLQLRPAERRGAGNPGGAVSCGCFGRLSAPPTAVHLVTAGLLALAAGTAAALDDAPGLVSPGRPAGEAAALAGLVGLAAALVVAVLTVLPATLVAARPGGGAGGPARPFHLEGTTP